MWDIAPAPKPGAWEFDLGLELGACSLQAKQAGPGGLKETFE